MCKEPIDPLCLPDIFVEGISSITRNGEFVRVEYYARRGEELLVVARIVWPTQLCIAASLQFRQFIESGVSVVADMPIAMLQ